MTCDWSKFRPLRRDREEDWSDWLAWLLETSRNNPEFSADSLFAQQMSCQVESFISPCVDREVCVEGRRADIVVTWKTAQKTHIEVKIWDQSFDKTFETAQKLHTKAPESDWYDFILIPSESEEAWDEVARIYSQDQTVKVTVIFWDDVVRGLRRCLLECTRACFSVFLAAIALDKMERTDVRCYKVQGEARSCKPFLFLQQRRRGKPDERAVP